MPPKHFIIAQGESQYGSIDTFLSLIANCLKEKYGYCVEHVRLQEVGEYERFVTLLSEQPEYVLLAQGTTLNARFGGGNSGELLHSKYPTNLVSWVVDPVFYHEGRVIYMSDDMTMAFVDAKYSDYLRKYWKKKSATLHLFGVQSKLEIPFEQREIAVFSPGSVKIAEDYINSTVSTLPEVFQLLVKQSFQHMLDHGKMQVDQALKTVLCELGEQPDTEDMRDYMSELGSYIDTLYRNEMRNRTILACLKAGISITVCGNGWNRFKEYYGMEQGLTSLGESLSFLDVIDTIANSKVVLNCSPFFYEGIHDRVSSAMLNGAVALTNESSYMTEHFTHETDVLYYDLNHLETSIASIVPILQDEAKLVRMTKAAKPFAAQYLTVEHFVEQLLKLYEK